jgi:hypothetical protein
MITVGDTPSTLTLVQIVSGIGLAVVGEHDESSVLDVAQWEPLDYYCEFQDDLDGGCEGRSVSWGTSDPYEPKFCTKHYFSAEGYEFVSVPSH